MRIGDLHQTWLEVIWQTPRRFDTADRVWKRYWKQAGLPPSRREAALSPSPSLVERLQKKGWQESKAVTLKSDVVTSVHVLGRAPFSGRFVLIRMPLDPKTDETVSTILGALGESHSEVSDTWSIYGLCVRVPRGFNLTQTQFQPGHLSLKFRRKRMHISWERMSFGRRTLSDRTLADWLAQRHSPPSKWRPGLSSRNSGSTLERAPSLIQRVVPKSWRRITRVAAWHATGPDQLVLLTVEAAFTSFDRAFSSLSQTWQIAPVQVDASGNSGDT